MSVDRTSALPLWAQVLDDLRRRMDEGEFSGHFPTDQELVEHYGVSRHTAREAVRRLQGEGAIQRERGRGTFVRKTPIEQPLGALYSLFRSVEAQGFEQRTTVRVLDVRTDEQAAELLEVPPQSALVYLERVRLVDDEPMALDASWMPAELARPLLDVDFTHTALYRELRDRCGVQPRSGWERIRPDLASPSERHLLAIPARQAIFRIVRVARDANRPVETRNSVVRGDLYSFIARWSAGNVDTNFEPAEQLRSYGSSGAS